MSNTRMNRLLEILREKKIEQVALTSPGSICYFTGHAAAIETGPSPFAPLVVALVLVRQEEPILFIADSESSGDVAAGFEIRKFQGYTYERPLRGLEEVTTLLVDHFNRLPRSTVGVEMGDLPAFILESLRSNCRQLEFKDITDDLAPMRAVKDEDEIRAIRSALELCDVGQAAVKKCALPGLTELEVFGEMQKAMEQAAGTRLPILADLVSGIRTAGVGGNPGPFRIGEGDLVIADIVPRRQGYWGDTCNTCAAGEPNTEQKRVFHGIESALYECIDRVRPGTRACDLDSFLRQRVASLGGAYPHHSGHGIGVTYHEEPRIVPYNQTPLRAGMVIALEPGIYFEGKWGLRLEHTVLVTQTGAEVLSQFRHTL